MLRALIEMREYCSCLLRDNCGFVILPRELADSLQRVKGHDGDKLDFLPHITAQQLNVPETADLPVLNTDEDLFLEQHFVLICIVPGCPSVPDATDHLSPSS